MQKIFISVFLGVLLAGAVLIVGYQKYMEYKVQSALTSEKEKREADILKKKEADKQAKLAMKNYIINRSVTRCKMAIERKYTDIKDINFVHKTELLVAANIQVNQGQKHVRCFFSDGIVSNVKEVIAD